MKLTGEKTKTNSPANIKCKNIVGGCDAVIDAVCLREIVT
jgi:hypothetical protein